MKPEWCPQWAWDEADRLADVSSKCWHDIYWNGRSDITLNEHVARALLDAHQRGRLEGMEEAAGMIEEGVDRPAYEAWRDDGKPSKHDRCPHGVVMYEDCEACCAAAIRAKAGEVVA